MKAITLMFGAAAVSVLSWAEPADAARRQRPAYAEGYVVAESRNGHGSIQGAVRGTDVGPQVQLPSGSWVYCRRSCSETLRVETVDRFENSGWDLNHSTLGAECGVFGCLDIGVGR